MNNPKPYRTARAPWSDQSTSRLVFEYHYLRRRLVELHCANHKDLIAIDKVMHLLDETRRAVRAVQPSGSNSTDALACVNNSLIGNQSWHG